MEFNNDKKHLTQREMSEIIMYRSCFLDKKDQLLLKLVLEKGAAAAEIARVMGKKPTMLQKRVKALISRLVNPHVVAILRHHKRWDPTTAEVALAIWVKKWTLKQTANDLKTTLHQIRQRVIVVKTLLRELETTSN